MERVHPTMTGQPCPACVRVGVCVCVKCVSLSCIGSIVHSPCGQSEHTHRVLVALVASTIRLGVELQL